MSRFQGLDAKAASKQEPQIRSADVEDLKVRPVPAPRAKAREGKKPVIGYFSEELSRELRMLSAVEGVTMQALLGEAIDLLMTARGKNRFGER